VRIPDAMKPTNEQWQAMTDLGQLIMIHYHAINKHQKIVLFFNMYFFKSYHFNELCIDGLVG